MASNQEQNYQIRTCSCSLIINSWGKIVTLLPFQLKTQAAQDEHTDAIFQAPVEMIEALSVKPIRTFHTWIASPI